MNEVNLEALHPMKYDLRRLRMNILPRYVLKYLSLFIASRLSKQTSAYTNISGLLPFVDKTLPFLCASSRPCKLWVYPEYNLLSFRDNST